MDVKPRVLPILREEAQRNGVTVETLLSYDRSMRTTAIRHYAMWRARTETGRSWWEIARQFRRDHTTVMYAYRKVEAMPEETRGDFPPFFLPSKKPPNSDPFWGQTYKGKPCRKGHDGIRYFSSAACVTCRRLRERSRDRRKYYAEAAE